MRTKAIISFMIFLILLDAAIYKEFFTNNEVPATFINISIVVFLFLSFISTIILLVAYLERKERG